MNDPACPVIDSEEKAEAMSIAFHNVRGFYERYFVQLRKTAGPSYAQTELQKLWYLTPLSERRQLMFEYVTARLS